jgi:hypothetical protein
MRRLCIFEPVAQTAWRRRCWAAKLRSRCVPQNFLLPQRDQPLLMPVDMREWLREDDLVFVVLDAVATLDLGAFRQNYRADGHGRAAYCRCVACRARLR